MANLPSVVICKCGDFLPLDEALLAGWLVGRVEDDSGRLVMRCPKHQSAHARRLVGLPGRISLKRAELLLPEGLEFHGADGRRWYAGENRMLTGETVFLLQCLWGTGIPKTISTEYADLPALVLAMSQVADLRRWFRTGTRRLPSE